MHAERSLYLIRPPPTTIEKKLLGFQCVLLLLCLLQFLFSFYFKQFFMFILWWCTSDFLCGNFPSDIFLWHCLYWNLRLECLLNVWYLVATVITCWRNKTEIINHSAMNQSDHQQTTLYLWFFISLFFRKYNPECCVVRFWTNWHHLPLYLLQGFNVFTI